MKPKTEPSLEQLKKEIEQLKKQKEKELQIATSMTERSKLLREINELRAIKKSPNALRNFAKTFGKGLKITGRTLWRGITKASRNLDRNAPEIKKFGQTMTSKPKTSNQPLVDLDNVLLQKPIPIQKISRQKTKKKQKRKIIPKQKQEMPSWGLP